MPRYLPAELNLTIHRRTDYAIGLTIKSDGVPVSLTGSTIVAQVKREYEDADSVADWTVTISNPSSGYAVLSMDDEDTDLEPGDYYWDAIIRDADGIDSKLLYGVITIPDTVSEHA